MNEEMDKLEVSSDNENINTEEETVDTVDYDNSVEASTEDSGETHSTEGDPADMPNFDGATMGNNFGDLFSKLGGADYSPILKQVLEALQQFENNNQVLKNEIDKHNIQIRALTLFVKISGATALLALIVLIIHMIVC